MTAKNVFFRFKPGNYQGAINKTYMIETLPDNMTRVHTSHVLEKLYAQVLEVSLYDIPSATKTPNRFLEERFSLEVLKRMLFRMLKLVAAPSMLMDCSFSIAVTLPTVIRSYAKRIGAWTGDSSDIQNCLGHCKHYCLLHLPLQKKSNLNFVI